MIEVMSPQENGPTVGPFSKCEQPRGSGYTVDSTADVALRAADPSVISDIPLNNKLTPTRVPMAQMPDSGHPAEIMMPSRTVRAPPNSIHPQPFSGLT